MLIPIRCMSCGKPVANLYLKYLEHIRKEKEETTPTVNISRQKYLESELGLKRYCCKKEITTCIDLMDKI
jgi:DNA-directed RNA polymerase subunit N (RpoN/RPB10)